MAKKKTKVYAITNQKGGIGKTTTATCITSILSEMGKKVLLVDTDVQCNSTDLFRAATDEAATIYDLVLDNDPCAPEDAIQSTAYGDIIASDPLLKDTDLKMAKENGLKKEDFLRLRSALRKLNGYDYIIIDTNPSLNYMLYNALAAADEVIIPVTASRFAVTGLSQLTETVDYVKKTMNPSLKITGLLMVGYRPNVNLHKDLRNELREVAAKQIGTKLFETCIRDSIKVAESQMERTPLIKYARRSKPEQDYEAFVKELIGKE